ncbi:hypothetical protein [Tissierella sp.]|uniref:hypothetical protein n=1 Tax=Tissierella sp. TaxID=41274 RepID=UPI002865816C|nr:hypothetical protein [Tissierella sp.]MDR7856623.1 hypothetical protein [Tissierella sp.]
MKKRFLLIAFVVLIIMVSLVGCSPKESVNEGMDASLKEKDAKISELEGKIQELESELDKFSNQPSADNLLSRVIDVMDSIKAKDTERLSSYVHPTRGLRFSPYDYIDAERMKIFTIEEVRGLDKSNQVYTWGSYDGTGDPIELNFDDYYKRFIYDQDFANPQIIGNNVAIGQGNTIDNTKEVYPNSQFIEFHFKEIDPQYEGMDWRSLKLVFEEENGILYLVAIVHGEWTI